MNSYDEFFELVKESRTIRRFKQPDVTSEQLDKLMAAVSVIPCANNGQCLRYITVNDPETCDKVFGTVAWAGLLKEWAGPTVEERPTAYIIIAAEPGSAERRGIDCGIAAQTLQLAARSMGLGCCMLGSFKAGVPEQVLGIEGLKVMLILAFGVPDETVVLESVSEHGSTHYWRTADEVHHVPKLSAEELTVMKFKKESEF